MKILSVEPGKKYTKMASIGDNGEIKVEKFETRYTKLKEFNSNIVGKNSYLVEYGDKYIVGAQGKLDSLNERTKKNELHKLATLTAMTRMLGDNEKDEEIVLVTSIPSTSHKSEILRNQYKDYYMEHKDIEMVVDNKEFKFTLHDMILLPETLGFYFRYPDLCVGKIAVVDIGGYNTGLMVIEDGTIKELTSIDYGGLALDNLAIEMIEARFDLGIEQGEVYNYLNKGYVERWGEELKGSREIITQVKQTYLAETIALAEKKKVFLNNRDKVYFIGGTSETLDNTISSHEELAKTGQVLKDAMYIGVMGNLLYAIKKYGKRNHG